MDQFRSQQLFQTLIAIPVSRKAGYETFFSRSETEDTLRIILSVHGAISGILRVPFRNRVFVLVSWYSLKLLLMGMCSRIHLYPQPHFLFSAHSHICNRISIFLSLYTIPTCNLEREKREEKGQKGGGLQHSCHLPQSPAGLPLVRPCPTPATITISKHFFVLFPTVFYSLRGLFSHSFSS